MEKLDRDTKVSDRVKEILDLMKIELGEGETLIDFAKLSGDDLSDLEKRKFVADLVVAKKLGLLDSFFSVFGYKKKKVLKK